MPLLALAGTAAAQSTDTVAIVYDGPATAQAKGYIHALFIENLLGHFSLSAERIPLADYQPGQLKRYRAGFFVGATANTQVPPAFLADVRASGQPFCWLGQHIEQLLAGGKPYGFRYEGYSPNQGVHGISYKGESLGKEEPDLALVRVEDKSVEVLATAVAGRQSHPYALHQGRFWYFADSPFAYPEEGSHYLVFCDLLHDILEIQHPATQRALVRIEDVSIDQDPDDLRGVADLLAGRRIPFQIAVIPIFRNPAKEMEVRLTDRRSIVDAIHYMIARGGTPVMHGVTHQYRTQSGDDYEFWDDTGDRAIVGDSTDFVLRRVQLGLAECFAAGIYPVAFETPHYAASETDYRALMRVFSLFYERTMSTPSLNSLQFFPYPTVDHWGRRVVPENVGYLPVERPDPKVVIENARRLRVVRDAIASTYFHPFLDVNLLDQVVRGIAGLGYHFVSLKEFAGEVDYQGRYLVRSESGKAQLRPNNEYTRLRLFDGSGKLVRTEVSGERAHGSAEVAVEVPAGGWAALDCVKERPKEDREPALAARLRQWAAEFLKPARASAGHSFATGKKAWVLWLDKAPPSAEHDQQSYRTLLDTFGYQGRLVKTAEFR